MTGCEERAPEGRCSCLEHLIHLNNLWKAAAPGWRGFLPDDDDERRLTCDRHRYCKPPFGALNPADGVSVPPLSAPPIPSACTAPSNSGFYVPQTPGQP